MNTIALLSPEIPQNTGNIARLCAVTGSALHIVGIPAFELSDKRARRAGLDYWDYVTITQYPDSAAYVGELLVGDNPNAAPNIILPDAKPRAWLLSTKGSVPYTACNFSQPSCFVFGNESSGTPSAVMNQFEERGAVIRIPMMPNRRSINLAVSVGIVLYEALRQQESTAVS